MQDAATLVYQALDADSQLITLLGGKVPVDGWSRIYNSQLAPNAKEYPRLTMFEVANDDANPADDEPQDSDVVIRIDVWVKDESSLFGICKQAKKVLLNTFGACTVSIQNIGYESDTQVHHKQIEINLLLEQESDL